MARSADTYHGDGGTGFVAMLCVVALLALLAGHFAPDIAGLLLDVAAALLRPLALASPRHAAALARLAALDPSAVTTQEAWAVLGAAARWYVWPLGLPLVAGLACAGWRLSVADRYRRTLTMRTLLEADLGVSPCIAPALNWPGGILAEPLDSGPWAAGRQPVQLVARHGLLLDAGNGNRPVPEDGLLGPDHLANPHSPWLSPDVSLVFDRGRAAEMFRGQMGPRWQGFDALPPHLRKLACAWVLFAGGHKDRAQALLDAMSLSFRVAGAAAPSRLAWRRRAAARPGTPRRYRLDTAIPAPDLALCRRLLAEKDGPSKALRPHAVWRNLALLALYAAARERGVLPTAEFLWLRPVDRRLWYLCNNMGRRTAWPEIAGPWSHYRAECRLGEMEAGFRGEEEPQVEAAVDALEVAMWEEGWLRTDNLSEGVRGRHTQLGID